FTPNALRQAFAVLLAGRGVLVGVGRVLGRRRDELRPVVAAVARGVQAAAGAAAGELPGLAPGLPQAGEEHLGAGRVEADVGRPGVGVLEEDFFPGLAAVGGAVDAPLLVGAEGVAEHGGVGGVGVVRVHDDRADLAFLDPDALPGLAGVHGLVNAVA